jgi:hypothetical protein
VGSDTTRQEHPRKLRVCGKKAKNPLTLAYLPAIFMRHYFHRNISR